MNEQIKIRAALESAVNAMQPPLPTAFQNAAFIPPDATSPFQIVSILFAEPSNPEMGRGWREQGYMQIDLMYPLNSGPTAAATRAAAIRELFKKNSTFSNNGVNVVIPSTPAINGGAVEDDRWRVPVRVLFYANFF